MNRTRTAYSIARQGSMVARGDHLIAANENASPGCTCAATGYYKDCELHVQASRDALVGLWAEVKSCWPYAAGGLAVWTILWAVLFA